MSSQQLKDDFIRISNSLERYHSVFYHLWKMGRPYFSDTIKTACVCFDKEGRQVQFLFNEKFYNSLDDYNREFVICHECLHVILNHGKRMLAAKLPKASNVAMDVVVNHALVNHFGFQREKIKNADTLCWLDTVFPKEKNIKPNETYEYYYAALLDEIKCLSCDSLDDHSKMNGDWSDIIDGLNETMSSEEKKSLKGVIEKHYQDGDDLKGQKAGTGALGKWVFLDVGYVKPKKKWETVIKRWMYPFVQDFRNQEQWSRIHRRLTMLSDEMFIPSDMEDVNINEPKKIDVVLFMDTSGSCWGLKDRFFKAGRSLPAWRFNVDLCCFDCSVYPTTLESGKIYGGGGTSFKILEQYIQKKLSEGAYKEYPFVFVITDGYGDYVFPQQPKKWHWFLSTTYLGLIPKESNIFMLSEFE